MERPLGLIIIIILFISFIMYLLMAIESVVNKANVKRLKKQNQSIRTITPAKLYINNEIINVHFGNEVLYVTKDVPNSLLIPDCLFSSQLVIEFRRRSIIQNKYLKINNQTKVVKFASNNKDILTIDDNGNFKVKTFGDVIIIVSVESDLIQISLKIIEIPLAINMSKDRVIKILGLPDERHVSLPGEYWTYKKYPEAGLIFSSKLDFCDTVPWEKLALIKEKAEEEGTFDLI